MLYLSPKTGAEGAFLVGTGVGVSISKPEGEHWICVRNKTQHYEPMSVRRNNPVMSNDRILALGGLSYAPMERILAWLGA